jgi:hypothetical protein
MTMLAITPTRSFFVHVSVEFTWIQGSTMAVRRCATGALDWQTDVTVQTLGLA